MFPRGSANTLNATLLLHSSPFTYNSSLPTGTVAHAQRGVFLEASAARLHNHSMQSSQQGQENEPSSLPLCVAYAEELRLCNSRVANETSTFGPLK